LPETGGVNVHDMLMSTISNFYSKESPRLPSKSVIAKVYENHDMYLPCCGETNFSTSTTSMLGCKNSKHANIGI